jgi:hypothetical protein
VSDESFVWQVLTYYYPVSWMKSKGKDIAHEEGASVVGSVRSGGKGVHKKGFVKTARKTIKTYNDHGNEENITSTLCTPGPMVSV